MTIPIQIRERLGIGDESEVEFELIGDEARLRVVRGARRKGKALVRSLRGRATAGISTDQVMALTRGRR